MNRRATLAWLAAMLAVVLSCGRPSDAVAQPEAETMQDVLGSPDAAAVADPSGELAPAGVQGGEGGQAVEGAPAEAPGANEAPPVEPDSGPQIHTLGDGDQRLFMVDHGGLWSMHAESMVTSEILRLWREIGGPEIVTKTVIDRPYTISVHRLPAERILARLLEGHGYTLHYDGDGRLVRARVYSLKESYPFKTPRLVESLGRWREVEAGARPAAAEEPQSN